MRQSRSLQFLFFQLAKPRKLSGLILGKESGNVLLRVANKWTVRNDRVSLRLSRIQDQPRSGFASDHTHDARIVVSRTIKPPHLASLQRRLTNPNRTTNHEYKAVVKHRYFLLGGCPSFQIDFDHRYWHIVSCAWTKTSGGTAVNPDLRSRFVAHRNRIGMKHLKARLSPAFFFG